LEGNVVSSTPLTDTRLSLRSRGIWGLFMAMGRTLTTSEIYPLVPEGRDAIRKALRELISAGYLSETKFRNKNGQWTYQLDVNQAWITGDGFSGPLLYGTAINYNTNSLSTLIELTNVSSNNVSGVPPEEVNNEEEYVLVSWPGLDEEPQEPKAKKKWVEEEEFGAIGALDLRDKKEIRNSKYKKTKFDAVPAGMRRHERPEELWTTDDLVSEFYELTRKAAPNVPSQVNGKNLATWINRQVSEGVERLSLLKAIRAFFNDPRLTKDPGIGHPYWRRFVAYYPTVHGIHSRIDEVEYTDEEFEAHQARMIKLLED